jgi:hypothetical protein
VSAEPLRGADYRAERRISTGADETLAEAGATCELVPAESLAALLSAGFIVPTTAPQRSTNRET